MVNESIDLQVMPEGMLAGQIALPGDKSISHRAMILGGIAHGQTEIHHFLAGADCLATMEIMQALGVKIQKTASETLLIEGVGQNGLTAASKPLDCANSGTSMRLLAGLLSSCPFESKLVGDSSLSLRPMDRIVTPLRQMGAKIEGYPGARGMTPPLSIQPTTGLKGIHYALPIASAQVKSSLLLAALSAKEPTVLVENVPTRDHTERMLKSMGCDLHLTHHTITLVPGKPLRGQTILVPGDISSAAFFIAGAAFTPGSHILLSQVGVNPQRTGIIDILRQMGANITVHHQQMYCGEPVADIEVRGAKLRGITVLPECVPRAIDEFPIIFVAAAMAEGETVIRGIQELRFKETDRILSMAEGLKRLGVPLAVLPDGIIIRGVASIQGGEVESMGDHRVAMAFAMAGLRAKNPIVIRNTQNIATSFPDFCVFANQLGLKISRAPREGTE